MEQAAPDNLSRGLDAATRVRLNFAAHGGMTEFYQAARVRYDFSEMCSRTPEEVEPTDKQRAEWLAETVSRLEDALGAQLYRRDLWAALQTRRLIGETLDRLGETLGRLRAAQEPQT